MHLQNFKMLLAICRKKLAIFASTGNYFRPWAQISSRNVEGNDERGFDDVISARAATSKLKIHSNEALY